mgnify:CR=1 FL=1
MSNPSQMSCKQNFSSILVYEHLVDLNAHGMDSLAPSTSIVIAISSSYPIISTILGVVIMGDRILIRDIIGIGLIIAGIAVTSIDS